MDEQTGNYAVRALRRFADFGDADAIVLGDRRIRYADLRRSVVAMSDSLRAFGVKPGNAVAVLVSSLPESMILQLAAHLMGCRTIWVAGYAPSRELTDYLDRAEADVFVYDTVRHERAAQLLERGWPGIVLCLGAGGVGPDLIAETAQRAPTVDPEAPDRSGVTTAPESVFYTSGTTGHPKLVHHGERFFETLQAIADYWVASGSPALRHLGVTGFAHVSGHIANLLTLFTGGTVVLVPGATVPEMLQAIERERITSTLLTPIQLNAVLDDPVLATTDTSSLTLLSIGGAPASPERLRQAIDRFGSAVRLVYGLTEAAFVTEYRSLAVDPEHPERLASCGYTFADARIEVRAADGNPCPAGTTGEVWVAGGLVMNGYWGQPELTRDVLVDGWMKTGDVGYQDADGYLFLVDRSKDMIVTGIGAFNVFTRPVEDALATHPQVRSAAVIGVPDSAEGEAVCAFVVLAPDATVTPDELRDLVSGQLTVEHAPKWVEVVGEMPIAGIGKIDKKALRDLYRQRHPA